MLLEVAPVELDLVERVEIAQVTQRVFDRALRCLVDRFCEGPEDHTLGVGPRCVGGMVLDRAEHLERVVALVETAPETLGDPRGDVALAPAEEL